MNTKPKRLTRRLNLRLPPALYRAVAAAAERRGIAAADMIREILTRSRTIREARE